ncbi:MAG: glycosyltransferase [Acidobacteriota bacterium]
MSSHRVDHFWANSSWVAQRIRRYYGRSSEVLAPPVAVDDFRPEDARPEDAARAGVSADASGKELDSEGHLSDNDPDVAQAYLDRLDIPGPFALAVSALVPYKKLDLAIKTCEERGMTLLVVGTGPEQNALRRLCGRHARLLGRVDDPLLRGLYRRAQLFLQPGVEDFGIASVEALASGTPVVAIGQGGIRDIVVDGEHGVLYEGAGTEPIHRAIDKFLKIRFNALKLTDRARSFSLAHFAHSLKSSIAHQIASRDQTR